MVKFDSVKTLRRAFDASFHNRKSDDITATRFQLNSAKN